MSSSGVKERMFDALTPTALGPLLAEHGRETANAVSFTRLIMAPYLFTTAASGKKGVVPAGVRVVKMISDGFDGYSAQQDNEFGEVDTSINSALAMTNELARVGLTGGSLADKWQAVLNVLHDTNGPIADAELDKAAQIADQAGNVIAGDLPVMYLATNIGRIAWIDFGVRPAYRQLGVASKATPRSQMKTVVHDTTQAIESTGLFDRFPALRKLFVVTGVGMTILSALDIMAESEKAYLESQDLDPSEYPYGTLVTIATVRTVEYLANRNHPTHSEQTLGLPEAAAVAAS